MCVCYEFSVLMAEGGSRQVDAGGLPASGAGKKQVRVEEKRPSFLNRPEHSAAKQRIAQRHPTGVPPPTAE